MLRMSKLTDYGLVLLTHLAEGGPAEARTAAALAERSHVPAPTVAKILKALSHAGLVVGQRGRRGGYSLARSADEISVAAVVEALDGPVALTECSTAGSTCSLEATCPSKDRWAPISEAIQRTLRELPLSALAPVPPVRLGRPASLTAPLVQVRS
jgi:FeS assembly SUF system regulator